MEHEKSFFCAPELTAFCRQSQKTCFSNSPFDNFGSVLRCYFVPFLENTSRRLFLQLLLLKYFVYVYVNLDRFTSYSTMIVSVQGNITE